MHAEYLLSFDETLARNSTFMFQVSKLTKQNPSEVGTRLLFGITLLMMAAVLKHPIQSKVANRVLEQFVLPSYFQRKYYFQQCMLSTFYHLMKL